MDQKTVPNALHNSYPWFLMSPVFTFIRSFISAIQSLLQRKPPHIRLYKVQVVSEVGDRCSWLPVESVQTFKSVIPADDREIVLGWKKIGFGKHHFGGFSVSPERDEVALASVQRELRLAAGILPKDVTHVGTILYVTEGHPEAREEVILKTSTWTGNTYESLSYIPARFHTRPFRSAMSQYSTDSLPSFLPLPSTKSWSRSTFSQLTDEGKEAEYVKELLPWHCMRPEDKVWYPLLISGQKFVGRVDCDAQGGVRRWWFGAI